MTISKLSAQRKMEQPQQQQLAEETAPAAICLIAYQRQRVRELLRDWSPQRLCAALLAEAETAELLPDQQRAGSVPGLLRRLNAEQRQELHTLLQAWMQRALGVLSLRDALLVDPVRGARVYDLLCTALTVEQHPLPACNQFIFHATAHAELTPQQVRRLLVAQHTPPVHTTETGGYSTLPGTLDAFLARAEQDDLGLVVHYVNMEAPAVSQAVSGVSSAYPLPRDLDTLLPPPPPAFTRTVQRFEQPTGGRRLLAMALALLGAVLLIWPLLMGQIPTQPAGWPLALLTLALMIGIKARWTGYSGALCLWLVPNLPGFHHDTIITTLWIGIPLMAVGIVLLTLDRHVRAMWRAVWWWLCGRDS